MKKKRHSEESEKESSSFKDKIDGPFNNAFAALKGKIDAPAEAAPRVDAPKDVKRRPAPPRAVVRMERKGRGGKEVTLVEQLELSSDALNSWLKLLKGALGCGGVVESGTLVLQGDHRERVRAWLENHGVKKISMS